MKKLLLVAFALLVMAPVFADGEKQKDKKDKDNEKTTTTMAASASDTGGSGNNGGTMSPPPTTSTTINGEPVMSYWEWLISLITS